MKNYSNISDPKDIITKEYLEGHAVRGGVAGTNQILEVDENGNLVIPIGSNLLLGFVKYGDLGVAIGSTGTLYIDKATNTQIDGKTNVYKPIVPSNLDYAFLKAFTDNKLTWTDEQKVLARALIGAITDTDYATSAKGGVLIINNRNAIGVNLGNLICKVLSYSEYTNKSTEAFFSKGTLENLKNANYLVGSDYVANAIFTKQDSTDNNLQTDSKQIVGSINEVNALAKLANFAKGYTDYSYLITELNDEEDDKYKVGQSFLIQTLNVPDLWIMSVETTYVPYTYTTDEAFIEATKVSGGCQVGYYKLGQLETLKQDLTNYVKFDDYATSTKAGTIRIGTYGTNLYNGIINCNVLNYATYENQTNAHFIGKGTLENVLDNEAVRPDKSQSLSDTQKQQARDNIGVENLTSQELQTLWEAA